MVRLDEYLTTDEFSALEGIRDVKSGLHQMTIAIAYLNSATFWWFWVV
jgi:hypothetical protein